MAERCVKGDYIGFTFGGVHSSELGLMRVSNGSRYEQDLLPPLQDKTAQVSGRDGVVYFNSQYNTKPIKVPVAFDNMTEESFQKLKELVMDKKPKYLWFDETPYKQWLVKAGGLQSFKWVCFDESKNIDRLDDGDSEGTKKRIYKGEGTLEFVCFTPYAESKVTFLDDPVDSVWVWNREESPKRLIKRRGIFPRLFITEEQETYYEEPIITEQGSLLLKNGTELYTKDLNSYGSFLSSMGYMVCLPMNVGSLAQIFKFYYPDDTSPKIIRCFYITEEQKQKYDANHEEALFPLLKNENKFFSAFQIGGGEVEKEIAILNINDEEPEYYYTVETSSSTKYTSMIFYKDNEGKMYLVDPITGEVEQSYYLYLLYYGGDEIVTLSKNYNYNEWFSKSGLRYKEDSIPSYDQNYYPEDNSEGLCIKVYNAGDKESDIQIIFSSPLEKETIISIYPSHNKIGNTSTYIKIKPFELGYVDKILEDGSQEQQYDDGFIIDSKLKMIKGTYNGVPSGNIYSKNHIGGDYFKIPLCADDEYYIIKSTSENEFTVDYKHYYI